MILILLGIYCATNIKYIDVAGYNSKLVSH